MVPATPAQMAVATTIDLALEHFGLHPHVTYEGLGEYVFCTAHCRTEEETTKTLEAFAAIPNCGLTTAGDWPRTVTIRIKQG